MIDLFGEVQITECVPVQSELFIDYLLCAMLQCKPGPAVRKMMTILSSWSLEELVLETVVRNPYCSVICTLLRAAEGALGF